MKGKTLSDLKKAYCKVVFTGIEPCPLPYYPRIANKFYADTRGFFWMTCPTCGKEFGGHEWMGSVIFPDGYGKGICPKCSLKNYQKTGDWDYYVKL